MHFKQLELFGFKSFALKTSINLDKGISAVVGPNGCGKSNIADAIRWVMGERKMRVLRGQNMEDVIFSGSDDKHPLGMAEVSLVLDNSDGKLSLDFSEVSVTRRLFRSGESEYYINKSPCRRKDVVELFMGTGTGADSYSLIEQGRIDLVLSSKPEERRYIFEDAAGIIKYKSRKDAALRKMERAEANLLRLQDTIIEVRRRINSLRRQASAAQRYRRLKDDLRAFELRLALLKYRELSAEHAELSTRTKALDDQIREITTQLSQAESELEATRLQLLEVEKELSHSLDQSRDFQSQIEKKESQIALLRERIAAIDAREKRDLAEIEEIERSIETLAEQRTSLTEQEREAQEKASEAQRRLSEKQEQLARLLEALETCESEIEELRSLSLEALNRKVNLQNERASIEANLEVLDKRVIKLSERRTQVEESISQHENRLSETRRMIESLRAALASLSSEIKSLTETIGSKESELEASITDRDSIRDSLSAARSKLSSLEELRDRFEGYAEGVRTIMLAAGQDDSPVTGVVGPLADLLRVEEKYEAALEAALGNKLQHIVVSDIESARRCIALLQTDDTGRASFIPLSRFEQAVQAEFPFGAEDASVRAADLVTCEDSLRPLVYALLGATVVVDSLDDALTLSFQRACDIVTLQGESISSLGIITAGKTGQNRGLLGRKNEIEELRASIETFTAAAETKNAQIADLKNDIEHCRELMQKLASAVGSHEIELAKAERDLQQLSAGKKRDEEEHNVLSQEHSLSVHEQQELTRQRQELILQIEHASKVEAENQEKLKLAGERFDDLRKRKDALTAEITDFKVSVSSLQLTCERFKHELGRIEVDIREANRRISEKRKDIVEGTQEREAFTGEIESCRTAIQQTFERKRTLDTAIEKLDERKGALSETIATSEDALRKSRARLKELSEEHHRSDVALAQIEEKLSSLKDRTLTDYRLSMSEIGQEITVEDEFEPITAAEEVQRLKAKIDSMGSVNLIAIEEFEELQQRYDLLIQQEADLRKAKEVLLGIIKKINDITQSMFMETFEQIRENFHDIFRHLFGGGRANIHLIDPSDPLGSGIEISVHPPGKMPQTISLLSGGEKALTAISLLFAIFKTRPSPFCVLDEVDAPLDDNNILRFTRLVKLFSQDVQFIVITHNKRTMELADVLYGVTMEKRGVSQIVSVKLKRATAFEFIEPPIAAPENPVQVT